RRQEEERPIVERPELAPAPGRRQALAERPIERLPDPREDPIVDRRPRPDGLPLLAEVVGEPVDAGGHGEAPVRMGVTQAMRACRLVLASLLLLGCGDDDDTAPGPDSPT